MKKICLLLLAPLLIAACQTKTSTSTAKDSAATPNYPYKIKHPDYWVMDTSHANTMAALTMIKAFETMDTAGIKKGIADSLEFNYDGGNFKGTSAEFMKLGNAMFANVKSIKFDMKDWESVVSKDKKEEWVTVWYVQKNTLKTGKIDSVTYVDDMQFKNGKMIKMDEYARHFAPPKK